LAGRLVGQEQRRPVCDRARDRDPLFLAAGQLVDAELAPRLEPERVEKHRHPLARCAAAHAVEVQGDLHVLAGTQGGQQVEVLEDEAERLRPKRRQLALSRSWLSASAPQATACPSSWP